MSHKWRRNKKWEDEHLTGPLTPIRVVLRLFETIPLAIVLLVFISLYATLASVPIGMLALAPTWAIIVATVLVPLAVVWLIVIQIARKGLPKLGRGGRFVFAFVGIVVVSVSVVGLWSQTLWPAMRYSETTGEGLRLFEGFVAQYKSTTLRRLPGFEMTELQFYSWWPMKLALVLFVVNMIVTTVRRIEFNFKNTGVLSVHAGIVIIALGSLYYQRFKLEGDVLLPSPSATASFGLPQRIFSSREEVVLFVATETGITGQPRFEQRLLERLPRYNDYNLNITAQGESETLSSLMGASPVQNGLDLELPIEHPEDTRLDTNIKLEVVGYANYAELVDDWSRAGADLEEGAKHTPLRLFDTWVDLPNSGVPNDRPIARFPLVAGVPTLRLASNPFVSVEHTVAMSASRWRDLSTEIPSSDDPNNPVLHALVIDIPEAGFRTVVPVSQGQRLDLAPSGWSITVDQLAPAPPFPIITPGYEDATSSVAILTIDPPGDETEPYSRWVFHRFPELDQDLHPDPSGRPRRTDPDPAILVSYLDTSVLQAYFDEQRDGTLRAIVRQPGSAKVATYNDVPEEGLTDIVPNEDGAKIDIRIAAHWDNAKRVQRPVPVPKIDQDKSAIGTHRESFVCVRASYEGTEWSETIWIPFAQYMGLDEQHVTIDLPDGRPLMIGFGRAQRPFPGFDVALVDFEMIAYDHRGAPRDYQSLVRVAPVQSAAYPNPPQIEPYEHIVKLNAPLRAPYHWDPEASWLSNSMRRLSAGLNPNQFKLSQSGWDRAGWNDSQSLVDQGMLEEPRVNFTILGVGNNPGIHIIALGAILISIGTPWAFYLKPWLVRRERDRLAREHAQTSGTKTPKPKEVPA